MNKINWKQVWSRRRTPRSGHLPETKGKKEKKKKKRWSKKSRFEYLRTRRSISNQLQSKMRWLNPDRNPCVQGSIRSLGFNFTDWFAPFSLVRILTRKVASAEPLFCGFSRPDERGRVGLFERQSRSHFFLNSRQQAILVSRITRALQRCVCF